MLFHLLRSHHYHQADDGWHKKKPSSIYPHQYILPGEFSKYILYTYTRICLDILNGKNHKPSSRQRILNERNMLCIAIVFVFMYLGSKFIVPSFSFVRIILFARLCVCVCAIRRARVWGGNRCTCAHTHQTKEGAPSYKPIKQHTRYHRREKRSLCWCCCCCCDLLSRV